MLFRSVFAAVEPVLRGVFEEFSKRGTFVSPVFPRIPYAEAMLKYGTDKPDLRNPIVIADVTEEFSRDEVEFKAFKNVIKSGGVVRAIPVSGAATQPRSFFDKLNDWARSEMGAPGLGYIAYEHQLVSADPSGLPVGPWKDRIVAKGPIAKFVPIEVQALMAQKAGIEAGDVIFFAADKPGSAAKLAGAARTKIGEELGLIDKGRFEFCRIVDFPMYEWNEEEKKIDFSHNPFSMPNLEIGRAHV